MTRIYAIQAVYFLSILGLVALAIVLRLKNPEMTETQLLLEFWWLWLSLLATGLAGFWVERFLSRPAAVRRK